MGYVHQIKARWGAEGGYRQVLKIAVPLILSSGAWSVQHFVDRVFLTWYSPEAIAASMPAGILSFTVMALFIGLAGYVSTFVAQYHGAKQYHRIGAVLWQGMYMSVFGGLLFFVMIPAARPIFNLIGHDPAVRELEIVYFRILCAGSFPAICASALAGFYSGRSRTWPVMWVNTTATAVNVILNYLLIFGHFGFPEMGIAGAGIATVASGAAMWLIYCWLAVRPANNHRYNVLKGWRYDRDLFWRLIRFGLPSGIQFFIDVFGFTIFLLLIGRLGLRELAASNIAFNINSFAFMPMIGLGITVSVLVGQFLGENRPDMAEFSVYSGFQLTMVYMLAIAVSYVALARVYLWFFEVGASAEDFAGIGALVVVLLRFVALYSLFDGLNIIFASALKGAGDTRYIMFMIGILSTGALTVPSYIALTVFKGSIYTLWSIGTGYIILLGFSFLWRFKTGKWKSMRVIETEVPSMAKDVPGTGRRD